MLTAAERFWLKVRKTDTCWLWTAALGGGGYPRFWHEGRQVSAHRWGYELMRGPIPAGLTLDHLCRVRHCVRPDHLEPVTQLVNTRRGLTLQAANLAKTACVHGHPFDAANTYHMPPTKRLPQGGRGCRTCLRDKMRRRRARVRSEAVH